MFKILMVLIVLWSLPFCSAMIVGGTSGYEQAVQKCEQQKEGD